MARQPQPKDLSPYWKAQIAEADEQSSALAFALASATEKLARVTAVRPTLLEEAAQLAECDALIDHLQGLQKHAFELLNNAKYIAQCCRSDALDEYRSVVRIKKDSKRYPHYDYFDLSDSDYLLRGFSFMHEIGDFMCMREHQGLRFVSETFNGYRRFHMRAPKARSIVLAKLFLQ